MTKTIKSMKKLIDHMYLDSQKAESGIKIAIARLKMNLFALRHHTDKVDEYIHENYEKALHKNKSE